MVTLLCSLDENLILCYRRYTALPLGNSSDWVRATFEIANLDIPFNAFALGELSSPEHPIAEPDASRLMHIALPIGKSSMLLGSDVMEMMGQVTENDNRNTIAISAESREEADQLFNGLSAGGNVEMPISDGPLGSYFGMFSDKFGVQWMVDFTPK